ncbi:hypothetical protein [Paractinoplanes durhamensis]|uniref:hypothetical protein n=1 Tax=Paractinoplanes durhamensis TaxID=113563 RepID=UPI0036314357
MTTTPAVVATAGSDDPAAPLVLLLHGRGSHEQEILALSDHLPPSFAYAAVRAPIAEGGGFAWFANRGIGRPGPSRCARPWTGSAAGSTAPPRPAGR